MKNTLLTALIILVASAQLLAQTINADEIIRKINRGENVSYENVTVRGELDFTDIENRRLVEEGGGWLFGGDNDRYESQVEVKIEFNNCTFDDDVLAYYNEDDATYIAHFEDDVIFKNCEFNRKSEFKYSEFPDLAIFSGSTFDEDANFKYAEFSEGPDFSDSKFEEEANFKYSEFRDKPSYANATFDEEANFKYAEFPDGVTFEKSTFNGLANFKYTKFSEPLNMDGVDFNGREDFKYTKVDGKSFTSYLIKNRD